MKKRFLKKVENDIKNQYPNYSSDKIEEIMYGIEGIYLTITKSIIIFLCALILGIFKELLYLLIAFNFIRLFAFGMHANKSWICLIFSSSVFLTGAFLCKYITISKEVLCILYLLILIIMIKYAPSETVKKAIKKKKKRTMYKVLSIIITVTYFIITLFIQNNLIINSMVMGLIIECILIIPITYKAFKMPYKNYVNYGLSA